DTTVNRAIEIYNPTSNPKSLAGYFLTISSGTTTMNTITLTGTVPAQSTFTIVNTKAAPVLTSKANQLVDNLNYSGNNVIGLMFSTNPLVSMEIIDKVGDPNTNVTNGYTVSSFGRVGSTKNQTLTRLRTVSRGNTDWGQAQFEWYAHNIHTYCFLGWHGSVCAPNNFYHATAEWLSVNYLKDETGLNGVTDSVYPTIQLSGQWSNPVVVVYDNPQNPNANPLLSCLNPSPLRGSDYDYNYTPYNSVFFTADTVSTIAYSGYHKIPVTVYGTNVYLSGNPDEYVCLGIDPDTSYNIGNNFQWTLHLSVSDLGIQSLFNNQIKIYPNPFSDMFTIENKSQITLSEIRVIDVLGREIMRQNPEKTENITVDMRTFDSGIYFVKLYNNRECVTVKLIKE
ncbi:MAG TPA: T9SS type A sorting domain-containing protein, partial [Nitrosopumilaceae archaeon]|nr:T9SS type A sorting domain-containing protein [Nitrosopumilaceae archaeon]